MTTIDQTLSSLSMNREFVFDSDNPNWVNNREHVLFFLTMQQNYFNDRLSATGILFLNDVLDAIGIPRTFSGQFVGWSKANGDVVDFSIEEFAPSAELHHYVIKPNAERVVVHELEN